MSPFATVTITPTSDPFTMEYELSISNLYHVMEGLGQAIAVQVIMTTSGCVTVITLSLITGVSGGTTERYIERDV